MWIAHDSTRPLWVPRPKPTRVHPSPPLVHRREPFAEPSPCTVDRHVASITCTSQAKSNVIRNCVVYHSSHNGSEPPLVPQPTTPSFFFLTEEEICTYSVKVSTLSEEEICTYSVKGDAL